MEYSDKLVVKTNRLVEAFQRLTESEIRVVQLAIIQARETGEGLSVDKPLRLCAKDYAEVFGVKWQTAFEAMKNAEEKLFRREFTIIDPNYKRPRRSHWIQDVQYMNEEGSIVLTFTRTVVEEITRIDGLKDFFTQYAISQTAKLNSVYSIRLYELMVRWIKFEGTYSNIYVLNDLRNQLGVEPHQYPAMGNFKRRVLDKAINDINSNTNMCIQYEQERKGRKIIGFRFKVNEVKEKKAISNSKINKNDERDNKQTWRSKGLTDAQIRKIQIYLTDFVDANTGKIAPNDRRDYLPIFEDWKPLLKDPKQVKSFNSVQEILDRQRQV